ncbi:MAG: BRO family protein [bacterium]|nr:BRO family protein [bacterium]
MNKNQNHPLVAGHESPFERIRRTTDAGNEYWSSRDFAEVLGYSDYRNFEQVVNRAKLACFNSSSRVEDHFVEVTEMIEIGKGGKRPIKTFFLSRYACYLIVQNADPSKEIVALGQTYFAVQTRKQEPGCPTACGGLVSGQGQPRLCQFIISGISVISVFSSSDNVFFAPLRLCEKYSSFITHNSKLIIPPCTHSTGPS